MAQDNSDKGKNWETSLFVERMGRYYTTRNIRLRTWSRFFEVSS